MVALGDGGRSYAQRLDIHPDQIVQELGWDDDSDDGIRFDVEEACGSDLLDEDAEHPPLDRVERANPRTWALRFGIHQRISSFPGRDAGDGEQAPRHRPDIKTATPVTFPATALHRSDAGSRRG